MASSSPVATAAAPLSAASSSAPRRSSKLLIGLVIAVGIAAACAAAYVFVPRLMGSAAAPAETAKKAPTPEKPIFVMLDPLTVNLQSEGRSRFLQIGMALKVRDEPAKAQIVEFMPELRSRLLVLLSNRPPESLVTSDDKAKLAEEIRKALNAPLASGMPELGIFSVSFSTFVVQ
ncbi:flagellar basal body-associated protein FliL [Variovorax sp. GB1P17]|uniref:flagellar basal body-associated protein FliL n=1 Tax=Variovorax sp. GB1P17 TaxID=3443740 RepID=UPI003F44B944